MNYGKAIKLVRVSRGLSQKKLAAKLDLDQSFVSRVEKGLRQVSIETLEQIANVLDFPLYLLFYLSNTKEEKEKETLVQQAIFAQLIAKHLLKIG